MNAIIWLFVRQRGSGSLCQSKEVLVGIDREVVFLSLQSSVFLHWMQLLHLCAVMNWGLIVDKGLYNFVHIVLLTNNSSGLLSSNSGSSLDCPDWNYNAK